MRDVLDLPAGRDEAVTALFAAHHRRLVGLARLLVDDVPTAEDVVQDAFASLYRRWPWLRDTNACLSYLQTAVVNGSRSVLRRRRTRRASVAAGWAADAPSAEATAVAHDERDQLLLNVAALPDRQRQVVVLRYYCDLSEEEIATTLSISRGAVKQHAARALEKLHAAMELAR